MANKFQGRSNLQLVQYLEKIGIIKSKPVFNALLLVDRANYIDIDPYTDSPQYIGSGQTISAPHMHATALEYLVEQINKENARVLDVGLGSGYLTAVMSRMNPSALVTGIDCINELVNRAIINIRKKDADLMDSGRVVALTGDGWAGYNKNAPYDCIHVGAAAPEIPKQLLEQLKVGGRMIIPVGEDRAPQELLMVDRISSGNSAKDYKIESLMGVMYVPLVKTKDSKI
mmetsp:Transcript_8811/g.7876  ORF Transcript_8811/g.7876 Transcript_8811/m.7876 type:complete len:229 (-) Transcript_8811:55-741(-)